MKKLILLLLMAHLCFSMTVVNSLDGRDVVSAVYYAAVTGEEVVISPPQYSTSLVYAKIGTGNDVLLVQSNQYPVITGMAETIRTQGNTVETIVSEDPYQTNLELAEKSGAKKFILVDPVYGYNTVSALAYSKSNSMYLLFADNNNAESVVDFISGKNPEDVLLYGYIDGDVKELLSDRGVKYREINNGDKFDDNLEITELYFDKNPSKKQVILSDGNAMEDTIAAGDDPVILISPVVPLVVSDYIEENAKSDQISVAMVVDEEYSQTAYNLKTTINKALGSEKLSVFVKIGESAGEGMGQVGLFPLRGPIVIVEIMNVEYNSNSKELEITYENTGNAMGYAKSSSIVFVDGSYAGTVGDEEMFPVNRGEKIGVGYPIDVESGEISINLTTMYGASNKYPEKGIQGFFSAGRVAFTDASKLTISDFTVDSLTKDLHVTFTNAGNVTLYLNADAVMDINGVETKITDDNIYSLSPGEGRMVRFPGLAKEGSEITAGADYGEREAFLDKRVENSFTPSPESEEMQIDNTLIYGAVILILVIIVSYLIFERKKK